jgi:hypothetical protein
VFEYKLLLMGGQTEVDKPSSNNTRTTGTTGGQAGGDKPSSIKTGTTGPTEGDKPSIEQQKTGTTGPTDGHTGGDKHPIPVLDWSSPLFPLLELFSSLLPRL